MDGSGKLTDSTTEQYIYIVQSSKEMTKCKIGKTNNLERRLKEYNNITGQSKETVYRYLFTCRVQDMAQVENDLKERYSMLREEKSKEIYFYNSELLKAYVTFVQTHDLFIEEIFIEPDEKKEIVKIVKKTTPSLVGRGISPKDLLQKAKRVENDEFYTRFEDVEEELAMYGKEIWENKVVFCNCDDAVDDSEKNTSAFALYFIKKFKELALKKLICTHYGGPVDLFNQGTKGYVFTKNGYYEIGTKEYPKNYSGSFDDPPCH
jgi:predicted GIY-YIG superfamily endonuclease